MSECSFFSFQMYCFYFALNIKHGVWFQKNIFSLFVGFQVVPLIIIDVVVQVVMLSNALSLCCFYLALGAD